LERNNRCMFCIICNLNNRFENIKSIVGEIHTIDFIFLLFLECIIGILHIWTFKTPILYMKI
jgi:hypothetical protein